MSGFHRQLGQRLARLLSSILGRSGLPQLFRVLGKLVRRFGLSIGATVFVLFMGFIGLNAFFRVIGFSGLCWFIRLIGFLGFVKFMGFVLSIGLSLVSWVVFGLL